MNPRDITPILKEWLPKKMVFVGGPRQVGKTTLALSFLGSTIADDHPEYLNWDIASHRENIQEERFPSEKKLIILDEVHKYARWRQVVKGFYDQYYPKRQLLVTGSARLDHYRKGGDSLQGRYHYIRLHPYTLHEMNSEPNIEDLNQLFKFGGFPEPLFSGSQKDHRIWQKNRQQRLLQDDITNLERVKEISLLDLLINALPSRVGSPLSIQNLREELQVSHDSAKKWLHILDNIYYSFRLSPFRNSKKIRAVKKEQKLYLWDWSIIQEKGIRFENLVASHLLKYCNLIEDREGFQMDLCYLRDVDKREVDFVVLKDQEPQFMLECKYRASSPSPNLYYFLKRTDIPVAYQTHFLGDDDYLKDNIRVLPFTKFSKLLHSEELFVM